MPAAFSSLARSELVPYGCSMEFRPSSQVLAAIIPRPVSFTPGTGVFEVTPATAILFDPARPELEPHALLLSNMLSQPLGGRLRHEPGRPEAAVNAVFLSAGDNRLPAEGYHLTISPALTWVEAGGPAGVFYALQTLRQLLPASVEQPRRRHRVLPLAALEIDDYPRFAWRGVMLDVARHFFPVETVMRFIDDAARY